jgi:lipopolysaccharide transport system ATP-binding protein
VEPVIAFEHVSKIYPLYHHITGGIKNLIFNLPKGLESIRNSKYEALHDISFEVFKGDALGIIGKNGAGKSTILGLIARVLKPTKGNVMVKGRISPLLELGAGFHPELTGRENILLKGILIGFNKFDVLSKMDNIVGFSELNDFIDQPVRTYSSGMLARLGFSIVANLESEIMLIDEILAVGDFIFQRKCLERMSDFRKEGVTMVLVSHSIEDIIKICERVMWMEGHRIKMIGKTKTVVDAYVSQKL